MAKRSRTLASVVTPALASLDLSLSAAQISERCDQIILKHQAVWSSKAVTEAIAAAGNDPGALFDATFGALAASDDEAALASGSVTLPALVSADPAVRTTASECKSKLKTMWQRAEAGPDLADLLRETWESTLKDASEKGLLKPQQAAVALSMLRSSKRAGALLPDAASRNQVAAMAARETELCGGFEQAINEDTSQVTLAPSDLDGLPQDFVADLEKNDDGDFKVGLKAPQVRPVLQLSTSARARQMATIASASRCAKENGARLEELVALRHKKASLLGFSSHAAYMMDVKVAQTPQVAIDFLERILTAISGQRSQEVSRLEALKAELEGESAGSRKPLDEWDWSYYGRLLKERDHAVDQEAVREYFPLAHVKTQYFLILGDLLGISFNRLQATVSTNGSPGGGDGEYTVWHEAVELYEVQNVEDGSLVGHMFLDLHPRPGKYGHQCVLPIAPAFSRRGSGVDAPPEDVRPACAILGNMSPKLLRFSEVKL